MYLLLPSVIILKYCLCHLSGSCNMVIFLCHGMYYSSSPGHDVAPMEISNSSSTAAAHVSETTLTVADGNCWQHCMAKFLTHQRLPFPSSELPNVLQHIKPKMIASPQGPRMQLNHEAVAFLRREMTAFLHGCEGVVVVEGK